MIVPSRRWLTVAAALAVLAPLATWWAGAGVVWLAAASLWLLAGLFDAARAWQRGDQPLTVVREGAVALSMGRPLPGRVRWQSATDATIWIRETPPPEIGLSSPADRLLRLRAGRDTVEERTLIPRHRGHATGWRFDIRVSGPWGLTWHPRRLDPGWDTTVYPRLRNAALAALPSQSRVRRDAGLRRNRRLGEGRLFESLREWVPGDELRTVDWKASGRRGKLIARQYEDERRQRVILALDAGRMLTAESGGRARLEDAIEAVAQLAARAVSLDDDVGLIVFSDEIDHFLAPARGQRALRAVLDTLAGVEGRLVEPDYPKAFAFLAAQSRKRALTVVFTDVIDRFASDAFVTQVAGLRPRHVPVAVTLRDVALEQIAEDPVSTVEAVFERAAAEHLLQVRAEALAAMRGRGVTVVDAHPDGAGEAVVACYLQLKRRALI